MKFPSIFKRLNRNKLVVLFTLITGFLLCYCAKEPEIGSSLYQDESGVYNYLISNSEKYSEFAKLIELTNTMDMFKANIGFTFLIPDNTAMYEYYKEKKVNSLSDFTDTFRQNLLRNHLICSLQETTNFQKNSGALSDTNAIGDYLKIDFRESNFFLNYDAKITHRNIKIGECCIQVINKVLDPYTKDIFTVLSENPEFSIFSDGLRLTGIKDTLQMISSQYKKWKFRERFTLLAVPDTVYHRFGIHNVDELISWCGSSSENITLRENPFYKYMEYHCLQGTFYLNYFKENTSYPVLSQLNSISMNINGDYKINLDNNTNKYTGFIRSSSNIPAKNGVIHAINNLLPIPKFQEIIFEVTNYMEFTSAAFYRRDKALWFDGGNSFSKIKFVGEKIQYYGYCLPEETYLNEDYIIIQNFYSIEITTPKLPAGRYKVGSSQSFIYEDDPPPFQVYIDNRIVPDFNIFDFIVDFGEVTWNKSVEHKIKIVCPNLGSMYWDYLVFTPIIE
jgi:uncharacterized surface protein with fasciclin (FAS1) repeats